MANDHTADAYRGLLVLDPHWGWAKLNEDESTYTQVSPMPGVPEDQGASKMVLSSPGGVRTEERSDYVLTMRGGFPGRSTRSAGFVVSDTDPDDPDNVSAGVDYRGWWPPNLIVGFDWPSATQFSRRPCLIRSKDGKHVYATATRTNTSDVRFLECDEHGNWTQISEVVSADEIVGSALYSCLCDLPDGTICVFYWVWNAGEDLYQIQSQQSSDGGVTWKLAGRYCLDTPIDGGDFSVGRIRAAYSNGQILLVLSINATSPPHAEGEALVQCASDDDGCTFTTIYTFDLSTGFGENGWIPDIFVTAAGGYVVVYADTLAGTWKQRRLASAFDSMGEVDEETLASQPDNASMQVLAGWTGEDGIWYLFGLFDEGGAGTGPQGLVQRSVDEGQTWQRMETGTSTAVNEAAWYPRDTDMEIDDISIAEWRGQSHALAKLDTLNNGSRETTYLGAFWFGGHSTVSMPYSEYTSVDASHLAWAYTWVGMDYPEEFAATRTTTGASVRTLGDYGLRLATTAGTDWYERNDTTVGRMGLEYVALFELRVSAGGSTGSSQIAFQMRLADSTDDYDVLLRFTTTGFRVQDANLVSNLADVAIDMTVQTQFLVAISEGECAVYYRQLPDGPAGVDREWILAVQHSLVNDSPGGADVSIKWGHLSSSTSTSEWKMLTYARGTLDDTPWIAAGQVNPDGLHPRPYSANPITLPSGARLQARNGPTVGTDRWNVGTRYTMGVELLDPRLSPDPRRKWRSASGTTQTLVYDLSPIPGANIEPGARSYGVCVIGFDGKYVDLEGYDEDSSTWETIAGGGTYGEIGSLAYTREGDTLRVDDTNGNNSTTHRYFSRGALKGAHLRINPGGIYRHVVNNWEGYWDEDSTTKWPVLQFDADDSEPTDGTLTIGFGDLVLIGHDVGRFSKLRVRLYFQNETDTHDFVEAGIVLPGPVLLFGRDYSRGRVLTSEVDTTMTTRRGGATVTKKLAPKRTTVAFAWDEGVDELELDSGTAPSYIMADGVPVGVRADIGRILDGLIEELGGSDVPCVYLPSVPSDAVAAGHLVCLTPLDGFVYGRITGPVRREAFLGDEGEDERVRVATITIRGEVGGMATTVWPDRDLYVAPYAEIVLGESTEYDLLLRFNGGDDSDTVIDDGAHNYTITYSTNDGAQHVQTTDQVLFGASSGFFFRRGVPPGTGGGDSRIGWTVGSVGIPADHFDWGADPDVLIGCAIWPTYESGDDNQIILQITANVNNEIRLWYDDDGFVHYRSKEGGVTFTNLVTSTIPLQFGEWNWVFVSMHNGETTIWVGTDAGGIVTQDASGLDSSPYAMSGLGGGSTISGRVSYDGGGSGVMNCYLDHLFVLEGAYIDGSVFDEMLVPTAEPAP